MPESLFFKTICLIALLQIAQIYLLYKRCKSLIFIPPTVFIFQLATLIRVAYYPSHYLYYYCFLTLFVGFFINVFLLILIAIKNCICKIHNIIKEKPEISTNQCQQEPA